MNSLPRAVRKLMKFYHDFVKGMEEIKGVIVPNIGRINQLCDEIKNYK